MGNSQSIKWWQVWLKLLLKGCPFVFLLDRGYHLGTARELAACITAFKGFGFKYIPETFDCDDFAMNFKALASRVDFQTVGVVCGWHKGLHCWNVALIDGGLLWIEPQTGEIDLRNRGYWPWLTII